MTQAKQALSSRMSKILVRKFLGFNPLAAFLIGLFAGHGNIAQAQEGKPLAELPPLAAANFQAIGRLLPSGALNASLCTGTLIAPSVVMTAAHCVHAVDPPSQILFAAGYYRGSAVAERRVRALRFPAKLVVGAKLTMESLPHDVALLELDTPIENVRPLPLAPKPLLFVAETPFGILGYSNAARQALSGRFDCATSPAPRTLFFLDCMVQSGNSGAPILRQVGETWQVVGVVSARGPGSGGIWSMGAEVPALASFILRDDPLKPE
ncbi:MAG: trypsin-like serine protease [Pseudomonadota bacterium]